MRPLFALLLVAHAAHAEPVVLRIATPAPEGTAYAREARAFARDVETETGGAVKIKFYLGGVAGDELTVLDRIRRGQLDGIGSGGMACLRLAPSMRVHHVVGLFHDQDEAAYVDGRMRQVYDDEIRRAGFVNLGEFSVGPVLLLTRAPVRSLADLRKTRMWVWNLDELAQLQLKHVGVTVVPAPLEEANHVWEQGQVDGFVTVPQAALAFQWSSRARYLTDLRLAFLRGCLVVANRAWESLPLNTRDGLRTSAAKLAARLDDVARRQDRELLGGLFERQGLKPEPPSEVFRAEVFGIARRLRTELGDKLVPEALLTRVLGLLADYRGEHRTGR